MNLCQLVGNRQASELLWGSLAETYAERRCEMHVHFRAGFVNSWVAGDWCAIFHRAEDWLDFVNREECGHPEGHSNSREKADMRQPVLVLHGKLVELPEGIVGESVSSVVRLQPLDDCLRVWVDAPDLVAALPRIHLPVSEDGELQLPRSVFGQGIDAKVGDGKLKDEVVEGRTEVVETIANDEANFGGGRRLKDFDAKEFLGAISIGFAPSSVRVFLAPSVHFFVEAVQVVVRPVQPPLVVVGHRLNEQNERDTANKCNERSLAREGEPSQKIEQDL